MVDPAQTRQSARAAFFRPTGFRGLNEGGRLRQVRAPDGPPARSPKAAGQLFRMNTMVEIVIASAARTPVGSFLGALRALPAHELGAAAIRAALERGHVDAKDVNEVVLGQVLQAAEG